MQRCVLICAITLVLGCNSFSEFPNREFDTGGVVDEPDLDMGAFDLSPAADVAMHDIGDDAADAELDAGEKGDAAGDASYEFDTGYAEVGGGCLFHYNFGGALPLEGLDYRKASIAADPNNNALYYTLRHRGITGLAI